MLSVSKKSFDVAQPVRVQPAVHYGTWLDFAGHLMRKGLLTADRLTKFREQNHPSVIAPGAVLEASQLSADDFIAEAAGFFRVPKFDLPDLLATTSLADRFSYKYLRDNSIYPCRAGGVFCIVMADPLNAAVVQAVERVLGEKSTIAIASSEDVSRALAQGQGPVTSVAVQDFRTDSSPVDMENLLDLASGAPVVRAVNDLLENAMELRATDIHIEPYRGGVSIRLRIDGLLQNTSVPVGLVPQAIVSRLKILSGLDIAETRLPQDGAAHLAVSNRQVDVRLATMPTPYGESAVLRLLPKDRGLLDIAKLGFSGHDQTTIEQLLQLPHGMIIVTGPTGSGKTTTLATMLNALNDSTRKILTIEDPIEYEIRGITQAQVKPEIGLTFASALRAFVRQDPDVIMVGEIRDQETAGVAIHAALTGHLVLTTLHTETAAAAVSRLLDLGVEPFLLQSTLRGVVGQRLVRILCDRCKREEELTAEKINRDPRYSMLGFRPGSHVFEACGCERCGGTGFRGRTGVFEVLVSNENVRELIGGRSPSSRVLAAARDSGMTTMFEDGVSKVRSGTTSAAEVLRVTTAG